MSRNNIAELLDRYQRGVCTPEEKQQVETWFEAHGMAEARFERLSADEQENWTDELFADIQRANQPNIKPLYRRLYPYVAAASVILAIGTGVYLYLDRPKPTLVADVQPFTGQVILHTGHITIAIEKAAKGQLAANVQKNADDDIIYSNAASKEVIYDTLEVTAGGKPNKVHLSDGSIVTVNVASKLRFPENFRAGASDIELIEGEAYFEIKHDPGKPITIKAKDQLINDIGTSLNVNTYANEPDSRTTLVEGKINVNRQRLVPGEQAVINGTSLAIVKANIGQVIGWIKGDFVFNGENIQQVMRELSRWYNIEVKYEGRPSNTGFVLKIARSKNISEVLNALERTNKVHFKIEGRRITVLSKK